MQLPQLLLFTQFFFTSLLSLFVFHVQWNSSLICCHSDPTSLARVSCMTLLSDVSVPAFLSQVATNCPFQDTNSPHIVLAPARKLLPVLG